MLISTIQEIYFIKMLKRLFLLVLLLLSVLSYKNDYILKDFSYTDEKKNHLTGTIECTGTFNPKDYTGITFQDSSSLILSLLSYSILIFPLNVIAFST